MYRIIGSHSNTNIAKIGFIPNKRLKLQPCDNWINGFINFKFKKKWYWLLILSLSYLDIRSSNILICKILSLLENIHHWFTH